MRRRLAGIMAAAGIVLLVSGLTSPVLAMQTEIGGNPHCADIGLESIVKDDRATTTTTLYGVTFVYSGNLVSVFSDQWTIQAVIVKAGPGAIVYFGPYIDLPGPDNKELSHVEACGIPRLPTTDTTGVPPAETTTTTEHITTTSTAPTTTTTEDVTDTTELPPTVDTKPPPATTATTAPSEPPLDQLLIPDTGLSVPVPAILGLVLVISGFATILLTDRA